jgi:hypothetical protein
MYRVKGIVEMLSYIDRRGNLVGPTILRIMKLHFLLPGSIDSTFKTGNFHLHHLVVDI